MRQPNQCELCGRTVEILTRHHLIPRTRHKNKRNKREFGRSEVRRRIAHFCRPCHDMVHALFTEKRLERELNTLESLQTEPEIIRFVRWIRCKPSGFRPPARDSAGRRER